MRNNKYSDLKILAHPDKLRSFQEGKITAPLYVRVKPTNVCDDDCFFCTYAKSNRKTPSGVATQEPRALEHVDTEMHGEMVERDTIPQEKMVEILADFQAMGVKAVTYSGGGEPLIYKWIEPTMERTLRLGLDLSIITNGRHLNGRRAELLAYAKWVRVSIDYTTAGQRALSRRVGPHTFDQVMDNLQTFARLKEKTCDLSVNYIIHRDNCDGLVAFAQVLKERGVGNLRFSPMWVPGLIGYHEPHAERVREQLLAAQALSSPGFQVQSTFQLDSAARGPVRTYGKCWIMQTVPVVGADQVVYACHNKAYDGKGRIGSIKDRSFMDLWFSEEARARFEGLDPRRDCRHECASDQKNININSMLEMSPDNFV